MLSASRTMDPYATGYYPDSWFKESLWMVLGRSAVQHIDRCCTIGRTSTPAERIPLTEVCVAWSSQ